MDSHSLRLYLVRYASRAKSIKNKAKINEDPKDALMKQYQKEIEDLRRMLEEGSPGDLQLLLLPHFVYPELLIS